MRSDYDISLCARTQNALKSADERSISDHLTTSNRALLWLSCIHLTEFDRLPAVLYDPAESNPSRLVSQKSFLLPWRSRQDLSTPPDILIALFQGTGRCISTFFFPFYYTIILYCNIEEITVVLYK